MKKKKSTTTRSRSNRLTRADLAALEALDRIVAGERALEQKYNLPFRAPTQTATSLHQCLHCDQNIAFLIFGDNARDAAGLEAYGRLMEKEIKRLGLPTYIIAPPDDPGNLDGPALMLKVYPEQGEPGHTTPSEWEILIQQLSDLHCVKK